MKNKKTILIAEDEKNLREALVDVLKSHDFNVLEANDGERTIEIALDKHPDLILLDIMMPKVDGMEALKKIRLDEWGKDVPVIILTNLNATKEQLIEDMITHKPLHYLIKADWKIHDVAKEISKVLNDK